MHAYWDAPRYVKNLEAGLMQIWERFLAGKKPDNIEVVESLEASSGTFDQTLIDIPSDIIHDEL